MVLWLMALVILADTVLICTLFVLDHRNVVRYVKLEEWAEDWLRRLEHKHEALECQIVNVAARIAEMERKHDELEKLLPKNGKGEIVRYNALLQQMNDEMEKSLKMEKDFNEGLQNILQYGERK